MKVVIMTSDYYLSAQIALKQFLDSPDLKKHNIKVVWIVVASTFHLFDKRSLKRIYRFIDLSGIKFFLKNVFTSFVHGLSVLFAKIFLGKNDREIFWIEELADMNGIPFKHVKDINSQESIDFIKDKKPNYLVSSLLMQIVKKRVLDIPTKWSINFHPALTQSHRWIFTSFWALLKNWKRHWATVHFMTEKIDNWEVILQKYFFIHPSDSMQCVNNKSSKLWGFLLAKALVKLKKERKWFFLKKLWNIFTTPTEEDVNLFRKSWKSVFKFWDLFKV